MMKRIYAHDFSQPFFCCLLFRCVGGRILGGFPLKIFMIVAIGERPTRRQDFLIHHVADENGVGPQIDLIKDLCLQARQGMFSHEGASGNPLSEFYLGKLVELPA